MIGVAIGLVCAAVGFGVGWWFGASRMRDGALEMIADTDQLLREARLNADITRDVGEQIPAGKVMFTSDWRPWGLLWESRIIHVATEPAEVKPGGIVWVDHKRELRRRRCD